MGHDHHRAYVDRSAFQGPAERAVLLIGQPTLAPTVSNRMTSRAGLSGCVRKASRAAWGQDADAIFRDFATISFPLYFSENPKVLQTVRKPHLRGFRREA